METTSVNLEIAEPETQQITAESNPEIWAILQPPEDKD